MYYRYKSKKRNNKIYRFITIILLIAGVLFLGNRYRQYVFFWKYNSTRLDQKVEQALKIADPQVRESRLQDLAKTCSDYAAENMLSPEAYVLSGKVHFLLGEALLKQSFSEKLIYDGIPVKISEKAALEFTETMKNLKKGAALSGGDDIGLSNRIMLAKAAFYSGYNRPESLFKIITKGSSADSLVEAEDARFLAILYILNGKEDQGLALLQKCGKVSDTLEGKLFTAVANSIARRHTIAIMEYQNVLRSTADSGILKLVHVNLGKIYFNQSLYNESLSQFTSALAIDERDIELKIWIGKNYSAMGNKVKAKAIWSEVLAADNTNEEVKKLLNPL